MTDCLVSVGERDFLPGDGGGRVVILVDTASGTGGNAMALRLVVLLGDDVFVIEGQEGLAGLSGDDECVELSVERQCVHGDP